MKYYIVTLFPHMIPPHFDTKIYRTAQERQLVDYSVVSLRDFAPNRCDDMGYGPGRGMVLAPQPLGAALDSIGAGTKYTIYPSPSGVPLNDSLLTQLGTCPELVFICGRYEGIDQRIIDSYVDAEVSIGNYVISSGELAALVIMDALSRRIPGVIHPQSLHEESFTDNLLEYPHYTRPQVWRGQAVPEVLLSGHHHNIQQWRMQKRKEKTLHNRRDMI